MHGFDEMRAGRRPAECSPVLATVETPRCARILRPAVSTPAPRRTPLPAGPPIKDGRSVPLATFCPEPASEAVCWSKCTGLDLQNETTGHIMSAELSGGYGRFACVRKQTCVEQL